MVLQKLPLKTECNCKAHLKSYKVQKSKVFWAQTTHIYTT